MLQKTHIAPSHRRMPHHTWKDSVSLVMDLLFGLGKRRYFSMARVWQRTSRVAIRGFSAGSYWTCPCTCLISWLTFGLPKWLQDIVEALMMHYVAINVLGLPTISMLSSRNTSPIANLGVSGCYQRSHCGANQ